MCGQYRGVFSTVGEYHEYRGGCSVPWGTKITEDFPTPHFNHDIPHGTEYPHGTQDNPPWYS